MLFIIKVTTNKEDRAIEMMTARIVKNSLNVYSLVKPNGLKGYVILEAEDRESAEDAAFNLPYVKGIIGKTVQYAEIQQMIEPKVEEMNIEIGDIVEMIGQIYKGEKAKVTRIDKTKGEVVVSLLGAAVPIPITVKLDSVKVIRREEEQQQEQKAEEQAQEDDEFDFLGL